MFTFRRNYFLLALALFIVEVLIALFVSDRFIRPYVGDYLVVILLYCTVRAFLNASPLTSAIGVLVFSFIIETLQYFNFVQVIGFEHNVIVKTVIGYGFEWLDLVAYTLGIATVLWAEARR